MISGQFPATVQHGRVCSSDDLDSEASLQMDGSWRLVMIEERSQVSHGTLALGHAAQGVFYGTTRTLRIAAALSSAVWKNTSSAYAERSRQ